MSRRILIAFSIGLSAIAGAYYIRHRQNHTKKNNIEKAWNNVGNSLNKALESYESKNAKTTNTTTR
ncbi:MAG: hypothetical protein LBL65_04605 [Campylobacteraceae bacterium]|jgi:hypothetical protein|nr:hypothetical protein [Campylobacteraceae bacterium]